MAKSLKETRGIRYPFIDSHVPSFCAIIFSGAIICNTRTNVAISVTALGINSLRVCKLHHTVSSQAGFHPGKDALWWGQGSTGVEYLPKDDLKHGRM